MINIFTLDELYRAKTAFNELINQRWTYINSPTTSEEERDFSKKEMTYDYSMLAKILQLISKEENK